jgi:Xaa-Pro dipeptidase
MIGPERYRFRQRKLFDYLSENDIEVGLIVDFEGLRNRSLRYLCGQPADAALFLFAAGKSLLVPWDVPLARSMATADEWIPFERYGRSLLSCIQTTVRERRIKRAELSALLTYPLVETLKEALPGSQLECRQGGIDETLNVMRMVKDPEEIALLRRACGLADELIEALQVFFAEHEEVTEIEAALFLEAEARRRGADGMGFDTLAASAGRSYSIHCYPNITSESMGTEGLSILDFGVLFEGYTSDVTLTVLRGSLSSEQEAMVAAVKEAYDLALSLCEPGADPVKIGEQVQSLFEDRGLHMPHSLGHGIGLDAHEAPEFRGSAAVRGKGPRRLQPGMVFTIEPGLYDPEQGGVRLENDLLCGDGGVEVLTNASLLYL